MGKAEYQPIEQTPVFTRFSMAASRCWTSVASWSVFERETIGKQLVRAIDSVGANLVEGDGRNRDADTLHFFVMARASAREAHYWLVLASERGLINQAEAKELLELVDQASKELNGLTSYRRRNASPGKVRELEAGYGVDGDALVGDEPPV